MCDRFWFSGSCKRLTSCENDSKKPLLIVTDSDYGTATATADELHNPTVAMALTLKSWLDGHRLRYLILVLCSPLLIPILCTVFPFLCAAEVCFYLCRRRRLKSSPCPQPPHPPLPSPPPRNQDDGGQVRTELSLLDRYLDDQLELALEILHECRADLGYGFDYFDVNRSNSLC